MRWRLIFVLSSHFIVRFLLFPFLPLPFQGSCAQHERSQRNMVNESTSSTPSSASASAAAPFLSPHQKVTASPHAQGEPPIPPHIIRGLGDRSYEKRKNAALDLEQHVKYLTERNDKTRLQATLHLLGQEFCTSTNSNHRKGGLIALAAAAIGLMGSIEVLLYP
ncbi:hypothetical protein Naga_101341g2, partial [Nannochloropsis gaditana]